jgi:site-specific DNA recombinase
MAGAAVYCRISQDREGAGLGVTRQEADCRALCERRGWTVVEVYTDNDVSAYSGKPRPNWARLIEDVRAGHIGAIVGWHVDRLTRSPRELEDVIDMADRYGLELATVTGEVDLSTPTGRLVARMLGAAASAVRPCVLLRGGRQAAEAGRVSGGGIRPFGYADDRTTILEEEAAIIRECAARVLAGESLASVCRDLADRGITGTGGRGWKATTLRTMLMSARISGRREHKPRAAGGHKRPGPGDIVATAVWPAIISPTDSDRLRALLGDAQRRTRLPGTGRTYLLSGILRCGRCGGGLVGRPKSGTPRYVCPNTPGGSTCGKIATVAEPTETLVRDLVLTALDSPEMLARLHAQQDDSGGLDEQVRDDEQRLDDLAAAWASGEISRREWMTARTVIEQRLEAARARLARVDRRTTLRTFVGTVPDMIERWDRLNVSQRRAIVGAVLRSVTVHPADPRKKWDPTRFEPEWIA